MLLKNVPPHILEKVLDIYHLDFVMFGYDKTDLEAILETKKVMKYQRDVQCVFNGLFQALKVEVEKEEV